MTPSPDVEGRPVLFLVDGSALAYRSHFAFIRTPLSNDSGLNTGAIFGYTRALLRILRMESPTHMAVVFDTKEPTFRHELFEPYKATRQKMPEEMSEQLPFMKQVTDALRIPVLEQPGFEADDVIGTLARHAEREGYRVKIVTGDKDFMQIVSGDILLYDIMKPGSDLVIVDVAKVEEKFGVGPERVVDVLALMGDSSDNVPGVSGVGEKTAKDLVTQFGTVEEVLDHADEVKRKRVRENLAKERDLALLSKRLVTIDCDVELSASPGDLLVRGPDGAALDALFKELGFTSLRNEFAAELGVGSAADVEHAYHVVDDAGELDALVRRLREAGFFVVDLETTGLDPISARIVGFSFSVEEGEAFYVPLNADPPAVPDRPDAGPGSGVVEVLRPVLEDAGIGKGGQNLKYDYSVMAEQGIDMSGIAFDTMLASYLLDPGGRDHNLDSLALRHFDYKKIKTAEIIGRGEEETTMDLVPIETVAEYAAEDADYTFRLYRLFEGRLGRGPLREVFDRIEVPLVPVLSRMERNGVRVDTGVLSALAREIESGLETLEAKIFELAGHDFAINSPKQLSVVLFEELKLHEELGIRPRKTKTGFSTAHEVLESMTGHPLPAKILEYRTLAKLLSTYVLALPGLIHPRTGRIHTSFNQTVAATGRLSSADPNLQNIPIRTAMGRRVRDAFVPAEGRVLLSADYSQIELRIMAHLSQDPAMIESFRSGADIHADTAARVFGVLPGMVDVEMRSRAKSINFGIMYGMGPHRLARETGMSVEDAQDFIRRYFETFPAVRTYLDATKEKARKEGVVRTLFGRQRPIPDILSKNGRLRSAAENMAVNTPLQGTAADLIKMAMIEVDAWMRREKLEGLMILQVHDELVFEVPQGELDVFRRAVPKIMGDVAELSVPLVVDTGVGSNWTEAH